jgi:hypothetical protein
MERPKRAPVTPPNRTRAHTVTISAQNRTYPKRVSVQACSRGPNEYMNGGAPDQRSSSFLVSWNVPIGGG